MRARQTVDLGRLNVGVRGTKCTTGSKFVQVEEMRNTITDCTALFVHT